MGLCRRWKRCHQAQQLLMCVLSIQAACNPPQSLLWQIHMCHIAALLCPLPLSQCLPCRSGAGTPQTIQGYPNTDPRLKLRSSELGQGDHPGLLLGWRWPVEEVSSCTGQFQQKPRNKRCCTELWTACCSATWEGRGCDHSRHRHQQQWADRWCHQHRITQGEKPSLVPSPSSVFQASNSSLHTCSRSYATNVISQITST